MKISTRSRYGLRALLDIAAAGEGPVMLRGICERQSISAKYLERILSDMKKRGILKSVRGAKGGFMLNRPPGQILILDVVRGLEAGFGATDCAENPGSCGRSADCQARAVWRKVNDAMVGALEKMTLADVLSEAHQAAAGGATPKNNRGRKAGAADRKP